MHSSYDEEAIDKQFIKVAKMKRKETLESKPRKNRFRLKQRKYNFVTTWDPMFPDIGRAIRKLLYPELYMLFMFIATILYCTLLWWLQEAWDRNKRTESNWFHIVHGA